jgi:ATP-dependent Clp protease protease subunit
MLQKIHFNNNMKKIYFNGEINFNSILKIQKLINEAISKKKIDTLDLHITSNGGDCCAGLFGYDMLKTSKIPIYTYCDGFIASSASLLFLGGNKRFITKNSFIMIHQLSIENFFGKHNEMQDYIYNTNMIMQKMKNIYLEETLIPNKHLEKILLRDIYIDSETCLKYNFVNKIL